ncbi:MAG: 23S rRNA (guanosine(2251)-2'-O)-methyltransferase RlmB [Clostridiales bacterium]|nr:23S rRNA (guanosine(2251)-2'-O)-methyltransferase RlmB [Clostridiales bacterium]
MTKADHLRSSSKWEEEGTRYRRATGKSDEQRREDQKAGNKSYNKDFNNKGGYKARPEKPHQDKPFQKAEKSHAPAPRTEKPALRPAFQQEDTYQPPENLLSGRNPIREAIKSGRDIEKLLVAKGDLSGTAKEIVAMARERHIPVQTVERSRLDEITRNHQGMLAFASAYRYYDVEDMLEEAKEKGEDPFLVILDGVTDPQNLGAIIRTAACVGAHGVIVPERRAVGLTPSAVKASAGAIETVKVARVTNLTRTLEMLKNQGIWLYAADMVGDDYLSVNFSGPMGLIIGAEGEGVSRLVLDTCDHRVSLPMKGGVGSLNASVAAGVLMYAALASRK